MERATKAVVFASLLLGLAVQAALISRLWPPITTLTMTVFGASCAAAVWLGDVALSASLLATCLVPATFLVSIQEWNASFWLPWLAAMAGAIAPRSLGRAWNVPSAWKLPLIVWALTIAVSWPIVAVRELDFSFETIYQHGLSSSSVGGAPAAVVVWIAGIACVALLAILTLDALILSFADRHAFEQRIGRPLLISAALSSGVGLYQCFKDVAFLNPTAFAGTGRTAGTLLDGNAYGMIAALWLPVTFGRSLERAVAGRASALLWLPGTVLFGIGVWSSGSRTALLAAATALVVGGFSLAPLLRQPKRLMLGLASLVVILAVAASIRLTVSSGPLPRIRSMLLLVSPAPAPLLSEMLWVRGGWGLAAVEMIKEHPVVGIGLGTFHTYVPDVAARLGRVVPPDNAQNWFRHQLAELGVLGALGPFAWTAVFFWTVICARAPGDQTTGGMVRGAIVGFTLASLLGMPAQDPAVALTFTVFLVWLAWLTRTAPPASNRVGWLSWIMISTIIAAFVIGTVYAGWRDMRPPCRAARAGWPYQYGFFEIEGAADRPFRWTTGRAVEVTDVRSRWLKIVIEGAVPPDAAQQPIDVSVWRGESLILRVHRHDGSPIVRYARMPTGIARVVLQIDVNRTWRPSDYGSPDTRVLGVAVESWTWVDTPPAGAITIE